MRETSITRLSTPLRVAAATLIALMAAFFMALAGPGSASAHSVLIDSSPTEGEVLTTVPTEVSVTFNENLVEIGGEVAVIDASQTDWTDGGFIYDGATATAPLVEGMPDGNYEFRWQVVSSDGHPISGIIPFSIDAGVPVATESVEPVETAAPSPETEAPAADDASNTNGDEQAAEGENTDAEASTGIFGSVPQPWRTLLFVAIGVALVVGIAAIVITMRRRSAARPATGGADANTSSDR